MTSVLVTGANRGTGLGLTRQLLSNASVAHVIATARDIDSAKASSSATISCNVCSLQDLAAISNPKLHIIQLDVVNVASIDEAVDTVSFIVGDEGLDILINNAGVGYEVPLNGELSKAKVVEQFEVNAVAPLLMANKFYPLLKKAAAARGAAQIVNISSTLGCRESAMDVAKEKNLSITGMSKSALIMLTRRIAVEWKEDNIRATSLCPECVKTEAGSQDAELTVDESTIALTKLILSLSEEHNGQYYTQNGEKIPW